MPENRKFKTISSIPKEEKGNKIFQSYFAIERILFSNKYSTTEKENLYKDIHSIIEQIDENQDFLFHYLIDLLVIFILIRPKDKEISCNLLSKLLSNFETKRKDFVYTIKKNPNYFNYDFIIQDTLYAQGIIDEKPHNYDQRKLTVFSLYEKGSLEFILKEDDINELKELINSNIDFSKELEFTFKQGSPLFEVLKTKPDFQIINEQHIKLLDFCAFYGSLECFKFLQMNHFEYGKYIQILSISGGNIDIIHDVEINGISYDYCFEYSVKYHHQYIKEWLLSNYKCELFSVTKCLEYADYETFLFLYFNQIYEHEDERELIHFCCQTSNLPILEFLLSNVFDVETKDKDGKTPLLIACEEGHLALVKYLISKGANIEAKDKYNEQTPLHFACEKGFVSIVEFLIMKGANIEAKDKYYERTPLHYACYGGFLPIVECLISKGANLEEKDIEQKNALLFACERGFLPIVEFLVLKGANIEVKDKNEKTPLHYVCERGFLPIVRFLIKKGANLESKDKFNKKAIDYACDRGFHHIKDLLISKNVAPSNK